MEKIVVREIDPQGRITIPIKWRRKWKSRKLVLLLHEDRIEIIPLEPTYPTKLFDSIEISENVDFTDPHSIRRAILELGK